MAMLLLAWKAFLKVCFRCCKTAKNKVYYCRKQFSPKGI